ncbi:hypothetical protein D3C86_2267880 [compost metagenome]
MLSAIEAENLAIFSRISGGEVMSATVPPGLSTRAISAMLRAGSGKKKKAFRQ